MTDTRIDHHNFRCDKGHEWTTPDPLGWSMTIAAGTAKSTVQFCPFCWLASLPLAFPVHEVPREANMAAPASDAA